MSWCVGSLPALFRTLRVASGQESTGTNIQEQSTQETTLQNTYEIMARDHSAFIKSFFATSDTQDVDNYLTFLAPDAQLIMGLKSFTGHDRECSPRVCGRRPCCDC